MARLSAPPHRTSLPRAASASASADTSPFRSDQGFLPQRKREKRYSGRISKSRLMSRLNDTGLTQKVIDRPAVAASSPVTASSPAVGVRSGSPNDSDTIVVATEQSRLPGLEDDNANKQVNNKKDRDEDKKEDKGEKRGRDESGNKVGDCAVAEAEEGEEMEKEEEAEEEEEQVWPVRAILDEDRWRYLIDWDGVNEQTGTEFEPTWELKADVGQAAIDEWLPRRAAVLAAKEKKKKKAGKNTKARPKRGRPRARD